MHAYIYRDAHKVCRSWRAASDTLRPFKGYNTSKVTDNIQKGAFHIYRAYKLDRMLDRWIHEENWAL